RQDTQGREARRPAGSAIDQVRVRHQHADGQSAGHRGTELSAVAGHRADRVVTQFAASARSRFWHISEVAGCPLNDRFGRVVSRGRGNTLSQTQGMEWAAMDGSYARGFTAV